MRSPPGGGPALLAFLERIGVVADDPSVTGLKRCNGVDSPPAVDQVREDDHAACVAALDGIEQKFQREALPITRGTSKKDLAWAKVRLVGVRCWQGEA